MSKNEVGKNGKNDIGKKKKYWFFVDTHVHISIKKDHILFYNTLTGQTLEFTGEPLILRLTKRLKADRNLRVIGLKAGELRDPAIMKFVGRIRGMFMGDIMDAAYSKAKPAQLPPYLHVGEQENPEESGIPLGTKMIDYLDRIMLYINQSCPQDCGVCAEAFRQFPCCTSRGDSKTAKEMDISKLRYLIKILEPTELEEIIISGGNILSYSHIGEMSTLLRSLPMMKTFYIHYLNIALNIADQTGSLGHFRDMDSRLKIPVTFPVQEEKFKRALDVLNREGFEASFIYVIRGEKDFQAAERLNTIYNIDAAGYQTVYQPFFTGENLEFFKQNVYYDRDDITAEKPTFKDIFARSMINSLDFGMLTIKPDGSIYPNINAPKLGTLGVETLPKLINKELFGGKSWKRIRKNVQPCKSCVYERVCPPISNYSNAIGKYNLCRIWPQT